MDLVNINPQGPNRTYTTIHETDASPTFFLPGRVRFPSNWSYKTESPIKLKIEKEITILPEISTTTNKKKKKISKKKELWLQQNNRIEKITTKLYNDALDKRAKSVANLSYQDIVIHDEVDKLRKSKGKDPRNFSFSKTLSKQKSLNETVKFDTKDEIKNSESYIYLPGIGKELRCDTSTSELQKLKLTMTSLLQRKEEEKELLQKNLKNEQNIKYDKNSSLGNENKQVKFSEKKIKKMIVKYREELKDAKNKLKVIIGTLSILEQEYKESKLVSYDPKKIHLRSKIKDYYKALDIYQDCIEKLKNAIKVYESHIKKSMNYNRLPTVEYPECEEIDSNSSLADELGKKDDKLREKNNKKAGKITFSEFMNM
ncbi:unnamed protein product [Blepharisma stoltei]|uniref:Uncharacterized protein n=1 Tax=Blepharisma stoltei TaxID=1481888 RepID=A0AAU9JIN4_9CILI|nr:unnamed protein product [Blepharisma stoltei]